MSEDEQDIVRYVDECVPFTDEDFNKMLTIGKSNRQFRRFMYGEWLGPTKQDLFFDSVVNEYHEMCNAGIDYRKARQSLIERHGLTEVQLHKAIKARSK